MPIKIQWIRMANIFIRREHLLLVWRSFDWIFTGCSRTCCPKIHEAGKNRFCDAHQKKVSWLEMWIHDLKSEMLQHGADQSGANPSTVKRWSQLNAACHVGVPKLYGFHRRALSHEHRQAIKRHRVLVVILPSRNVMRPIDLPLCVSWSLWSLIMGDTADRFGLLNGHRVDNMPMHFVLIGLLDTKH